MLRNPYNYFVSHIQGFVSGFGQFIEDFVCLTGAITTKSGQINFTRFCKKHSFAYFLFIASSSLPFRHYFPPRRSAF